MKIFPQLKIALVGIKTNKARSALTILGIVIGIAAIMGIMSIGKSVEGLILNEISGFGAETIVIRPGKEPQGPSDISGTLFSDSLTTRDVEALKRKGNVYGLVDVAPAVIVPGSVAYEGETFRPMIMGWTATMMEDALNIYPKEGAYFTDLDIRQNAAVAIIGSKVKEELFGNQDALGKNIKIKDKSFRIVGIFDSRGQVAFFNVDEIVLIPYTTAQKYLLGIDHFHEVIVRVDDPLSVTRAVLDIEYTLRDMHGITNPEKDDFFVVTQEGMIDQISNIISMLTFFLTAVVAIALVVGGIGIMNIMLVSVTERTREIGLRKAVGATERDIMTQFLTEAVVLTGVGGIVGIIIGALFSLLASYVLSATLSTEFSFTFPLSAALLGIVVSGAVGLVFGAYPAKKAAVKDPIEALRYE